MSRRSLRVIVGLIGLGIFFSFGSEAEANELITIAPAKQEVTINPGETKIINLTITSTLTTEVDFNLAVNDLVVGQNSLKEIVVLPTQIKTLTPGQSVNIPIEINVPAGAYPGSRYGQIAVIVKGAGQAGEARAQITTQLNSLLFVRVPGDITELGQISKFGLLNGPLVTLGQKTGFYITFTNQGTGYLNPYGLIKINNWRGRELGYAVIDPWYVLPSSSRTRDIADLILPTGLYRAELELNRGYDNIVDIKNVWFVVLPVWAQYLALGLGALLVFVFGYRIIKR